MEFEDCKVLLKNSIFGNLPPEEIDQLARAVEIRTFRPNEVIFEQGDPADAFFIISSGRVRIFVRLEDRSEVELPVFGPGEYFGEVDLLTVDTRTAGAVSIEETELIVLNRKQFDRLISDHPDFPRYFVRHAQDLIVKDRRIIKQSADAAIKYSKAVWSDFVLLIGTSVLLAIMFNISNPNGIPFFPDRPDSAPLVSPAAAIEDYKQGQTMIIDAMPSNFYQKKHIKGAINMPMAIFDFVYLMSFSEKDKGKEIVVYGNTVSRPYDLEIADKLALNGHRNVKILDGGLRAWEADGYPVVQGASE